MKNWKSLIRGWVILPLLLLVAICFIAMPAQVRDGPCVGDIPSLIILNSNTIDTIGAFGLGVFMEKDITMNTVGHINFLAIEVKRKFKIAPLESLVASISRLNVDNRPGLLLEIHRIGLTQLVQITVGGSATRTGHPLKCPIETECLYSPLMI